MNPTDDIWTPIIMPAQATYSPSQTMRFQTTDELSSELIRLRLATESQLADASSRYLITSDPDSLLKALESMNVLTNYQAQRLRETEKSPIVLDNYKLMYQNASGSFARVFRACRIDNGEMIGVKVLRQRYAEDPTAVAHFHREAELCAKLKHKNIVPIYEVGFDDGFHYFTMEFIEGGNLRDIVKIRGVISPAETLRLALDMAEGLEYALAQGMTHRDFKLSNVLMSSSGIAKLVDFGLAGDEGSAEDATVHAVEYATIEKGTRCARNDPRSDLYFLGAALYEMATGVPPYPPSRSIDDRKRFSRYSGVRKIRSISPNIPGRLADIIDRLMQINPHERYQTATELIKDLREALVEYGPDPRQAAVAGAAAKSGAMKTILCVEDRPKQQDMLREYLTKHGYRALMLSNWDRALARLKTNPPDCVVVVGDSVEGNLAQICDDALLWCGTKNVPCVLVLPKSSADWSHQLLLKKSQRAVTVPLTLRDIRMAITETIDAAQS